MLFAWEERLDGTAARIRQETVKKVPMDDMISD
jgi:hypothetical protein